MDDIGEILVLVGVATLICGDWHEVWAIAFGMIALGAILYFADRVINGR